MDLKFALRSLWRTPAFTFLSVLILALGVGANTAIFSVIHAVVLRPLGYRNPDQLVSVSMTWPDGERFGQVSGPDFLDFESQNNAFESMAAYGNEIVSVVANGKSEFVGMAAVSKDFLQTLAVVPVAGRAFVPADFDRKPAAATVSAGFWERHFGDVPFSRGHILKTAGVQLEIIGLLPPGFHFPESSQTEVWTPLFEVLKETNRGAHNYLVVGRLKPGVSSRQAQAQLSVIANRLEKDHPGTNKGEGVYVTSLANYTVRNVKASLYILMAAVVLVLLIACANVANLLLARGTGRTRELAIRTALGASRTRIVRQLFAETLILAGTGCFCGVVLVEMVMPALVALAPNYLPRLSEIRVDSPTLLFCIGLGLLSSVLFGVAPALQGSRVDLNRNLRGGGSRGVVESGGRLRHLFVIVEIALSIVLLVPAGLLLQSFSAITAVNLGFRPQKLLVGHISVPVGDAKSATSKLFQPLMQILSSHPAFRSAALTHGLPADPDSRSTSDYIVEGQTLDDMTVNAPQAGDSVVSGSYFRTMSIPLIAGRTFSEREIPSAPPVAIVNRAFVRRSYPNADPIGRKLLCGFDSVGTPSWATIVGVVADAHMDGPVQTPMPEIYFPYLQHPRQEFDLIVQAGTNPLTAAPLLRSIVHRLDPETSIRFTTMESHLAKSVATPRFSSTLIAIFAGLAVLLAFIGIYAVISYSVSRRVPEIGLRMALGADRASVLRMILLEALKLSTAGLLIGAVGAIAVARLLKSQLFHVSASDPANYIEVLFLIALLTVISSYMPARRASHVQPLEALRQE